MTWAEALMTRLIHARVLACCARPVGYLFPRTIAEL
jgi:hypothetical protein